MGCGDEKLSKYLTQTFTAHCNAMICQQVTLLGDAEWPKVADAVIEARLTTPDTWEFGRRQSDHKWWLHWLFDSMTDRHKGPTWFQQQLLQWFAQLPAKRGTLGADLA